MSLFSKRTSRVFESGDVVTIIGPEAYFHGVLTVRGSVRVEGEVEGDITEAQSVIIGKQGRVRGDVCAELVVSGGTITGDVVATVQLELKSGGKVTGNIRTPKLIIEEGAVLDGHCAMSEPSPESSARGKRHHKEGDQPKDKDSTRETETLSS